MDYKKKSKEELIKEIESLNKEKEDFIFTLNKIKKAENELKISEKSYKNLFDNSINLLYIADRQGNFIDVNKVVINKYGYKKEEIIGKNFQFLGEPNKNDIKKTFQIIDNVWNGKTEIFKWWSLKKNKEVFIKEVVLRKGIYFGKDVLVIEGKDITEKIEIEEYLKENKEKYRTIFSKNLAGVFITENEKIIDCNNSFAKIFGYKSRVELIGKSVISLYFNKKDRKKYITDLKEKKQLTNYIVKHKKRDGTDLWISTNVSIYLLENNKYKTEGTLVDITKEIKFEKELIESRENYKRLTEQSSYATLIHINGEIIYANQKAFQFLGVKDFNELKGKLNLFDYLPTKYQKEALIRRKKVMRGDIVPFVELKIKKPLTKEIIEIETKSTVIDYKGEKAIHLVFQDISDRKKLEKDQLKLKITEASNKALQNEIIVRKKIEKKLNFNQKYTSSIINSSLDIICASDKNGKIIEFNHAAEKAFGYKEKEVLNKSIQLVYESKEEYLKISRGFKNKKHFIGEIKNKRKNGEIFTSFLSASTLYDNNNNIIGTMGVSRDITELKEAEEQLIESEERYRDLFENASDLIQSVDMEGNIIYVNDAWKKTLGYFDEDIKNIKIFDLVHEEYKEKYLQEFNQIIKRANKKAIEISFALKTNKGEKIIVKGNVSLKFKNGKPHSTRGILRNITNEEWEKSLQEAYNNIAKIVTETITPEETYEKIRKEIGKIINTNVFIISFLLENERLTFPYYYEEGKIIHKRDRNRGNGINEYFLNQKKTKILKRKELEERINKGEFKLIGKKCRTFIGVPLKIKNKIVGVLSIQSFTNENQFTEKDVEFLNHISGILALTVQRKQDEKIIYNQSARLKSIIENSTHLFWTYDNEKGVTSSNKNFIDYIKRSYNKKIVVKDKIRYSNKKQHSFWDKKYNLALKGETQHFIYENVNNKGENIIKEVFLNPIYNEESKILEVSGIAHDITEKKRSEQKLKESLHEKEILLKEVHHRVKNNLQVISSILNLQSSYIKDENTLNILKESQNRIKSMSFIHESLYKTDDFSKINFSEYISSLSKNLVYSYGVYDNLVELETSLEDISLNLDLSIPCGLIINELVSNALKYAFPDAKKGKIKIELFEKKGVINLIVEDNGLGLPKSINYKQTDSLGLQLVMTLAEQIEAKVTLDNTKGAKYNIIFKKEQ